MHGGRQRGDVRTATALGIGLVVLAVLAGGEPLVPWLREAALLDSGDLERLWATLSTLPTGSTLAVIFGILFISGIGLPLPEDIPLTFTGILLSLPATATFFGGFEIAVAVISFSIGLAILSGDLIAYGMGRRFGNDLATWPGLRLALRPKRRARLEHWFARYGNWAVFFGRMVAGVRFVTFVSAGIARMPVTRFLFYDGLAAAITVPFWMVLGYLIGTHFDRLIVWIGRVNTTTWVAAAVGLLVLLILRVVVRRRRARRAEPAPPA
ncbi:MAG: DedA family protein [Deltaproteobacteria bacterium]|nr:DedA family protein [Deltaproteobacteria bacterium]